MIGLVLCRTRNQVIADYTPRNTREPMGVVTFTLADGLPEKIRAELPTIKAIGEQLRE